MATKKTTKKKATPAEFTLGGETFRAIPKEEWTVEQDDYAMSIMMDLSFDLSELDTDNDRSGRMIVRELTRTGRYREMLGVSLRSTDADRTVLQNVERFQTMKLSMDEAMPAVMAAVNSFFGSGES